jgi:hypothetical protein
MHVGFRSLRDTGITWLALAGVDVVKIQRRAGHDEISTTMGYVKVAEDIGGAIGEPFPALPSSLLNPDGLSSGEGLGQRLGQVTTLPKTDHEKRSKSVSPAGHSRDLVKDIEGKPGLYLCDAGDLNLQRRRHRRSPPSGQEPSTEGQGR